MSNTDISNDMPTDVPLKSSMRVSKSDTDLMKEDPESDTSMATASTAGSTTGTESGEGSGDDSIASGSPAIPVPKPMSKRNRTVSFTSLEAFTFPVIQGDPNFEMAYPMTLGWDCWNEETHNIDDYEAERGPRRKQDELRTMTEERKKIIRDSKKQGKHRRRESIGNGQIGKDARRNRVQEFLLASANAISGNVKPAQETAPPQRGLRRQNSIGNGEISRLSKKKSGFVADFLTTMSSSGRADSTRTEKNDSTRSEPEDLRVSPRRGGLRRQNSIGNGEISRHKMRNSVQKFLKTMGSFGSSKKDEPVYDRSVVVVKEPAWPPVTKSSSAEFETATTVTKTTVAPAIDDAEEHWV